MLSDRQIRGAKPTAKHQFISDGNGLYLRVHPSGKKQFVYRSRVGGKARWVVIGEYPTLPLADARRKALDLKQETPGSVTVAEAWDAFYRSIVQRDFRRPEQQLAMAKLDILPTLGKRYLTDLTRAEVSAMLQAIVDRGSPVAANRTMSLTKHLFSYCMDRGWITTSPAERLRRRSVGGREAARARVLSDAEIEHFLHLRGEFLPLVWLWGYLLLLTGQRNREVQGIHRSEVEGRLWTIPAERTKSQRAHKVHISREAAAVLRIAFRYGDTPFLLHSKHTLAQRLQRLKVGYTPHDLRRTFATRLADMGVAPHVVEKLLNHKMTGVMAVYNRAEFLPERQAAMDDWGRMIRALRKKAPGDDRPGA